MALLKDINKVGPDFMKLLAACDAAQGKLNNEELRDLLLLNATKLRDSMKDLDKAIAGVSDLENQVKFEKAMGIFDNVIVCMITKFRMSNFGFSWIWITLRSQPQTEISTLSPVELDKTKSRDWVLKSSKQL